MKTLVCSGNNDPYFSACIASIPFCAFLYVCPELRFRCMYVLEAGLEAFIHGIVYFISLFKWGISSSIMSIILLLPEPVCPDLPILNRCSFQIIHVEHVRAFFYQYIPDVVS